MNLRFWWTKSLFKLRHEEADNQIALVRWFRIQYPELSELLVSYPAGMNLSLSQRIRARNMGLTAGVPDLILFVPMIIGRQFCPCLFIEMKSKNGKLSEVQKSYHRRLKKMGYTIVVSYSCEDAMKSIKSYLEA